MKTNKLTHIDLDLLTADQVAPMLKAKRSTVLNRKNKIGFSKPCKEVFFRFDDVARYALKTTYTPPADLVMNEEQREESIRAFIQDLRNRLESA